MKKQAKGPKFRAPLDDLTKFLTQIPALEYCERMGYDCAFNGANTTNCDFRLFRSPEHTRAWECGKKRGECEQKIVKAVNKSHKSWVKKSWVREAGPARGRKRT